MHGETLRISSYISVLMLCRRPRQTHRRYTFLHSWSVVNTVSLVCKIYRNRFADHEIEITQALLEKILVYDKAMTLACDICAELDCLLSFAQASRSYDYRRPVMSEENIIDIRQGRRVLSRS